MSLSYEDLKNWEEIYEEDLNKAQKKTYDSFGKLIEIIKNNTFFNEISELKNLQYEIYECDSLNSLEIMEKMIKYFKKIIDKGFSKELSRNKQIKLIK